MHKIIRILNRVWVDDAGAYPLLRLVLVPLAVLYTAWMRIRTVLYDKGLCLGKKLPCRVISVGNLSVGGTGKTPMVLYLAKLLTEKGLKVVIISRGYRGRLEAAGGIVSDGRKVLVGVHDSGDEPQIMARLLQGVPVIVGGNRYRAGQRALEAFSPDVILLDDAFQHLRLKRDLDLVLLDCSRPFGNGYTLPAGDLREPPRALGRGHAAIMTRCQSDQAIVKNTCREVAGYIGGPVFESRHVPVIRNIIPAEGSGPSEDPLSGRRAFAFSGVAKNDEFLYTLSGFNCEVVRSQQFSDHHFYTDNDLESIRRKAESLNVDCIVTTEKDYVKVGPTVPWPADLVILGIDISFGDDTNRFQDFLANRIQIGTD